jgi:large subunit ribosomal protein L23
VTAVNIINTMGKTKRFKGTQGTRGSYKKAIVTLKEGQSINFSS